MMQWLSKQLDWQFIKILAGSRIVAAAALFPFVGYLILLNSDLVGYLTLYFDVAAGAVNSAIIRVSEIYFSLIWISLGSIFYQLFCPEEIKKFQSRYEYILAELEVVHPARLKKLQNRAANFLQSEWFTTQGLTVEIKELLGFDFSDSTSVESIDPLGYSNRASPRSEYLAIVGNRAVEILTVTFDCACQKNFFARAFCFLTISIGYLKLSIPSIKVFYQLLTL